MKGAVKGAQRLIRAQPLTSIGLGLTLVVPCMVLLLTAPTERQIAQDLDVRTTSLLQISDQMRMVQSFRANGSASPPSLWTRRFGADTANQVWQKLKGQMWWMGWPQDGDPVLVLPASDAIDVSAFTSSNSSDAALKVSSRRLPGLVLVFADELNRQTFGQAHQTVAINPSPLETFCLAQLMRTTAVIWRPEALSSIAGALSPLLQTASYGCLELSLEERKMRWEGVVASRPLRTASRRLAPPIKPIELSTLQLISAKAKSSHSSSRPLLRLKMRNARTLLGAVINRPLIRDGLQNDYALSTSIRSELLATPLSVQIQSEPQGPFQASLKLDLYLSDRQTITVKTLDGIGRQLREGGLIEKKKKLSNPDRESFSQATLWYQNQPEGQRLLGGWVWLQGDQSTDRSTATPPVLRLSLASSPTTKRSMDVQLKTGEDLRLTMRASALDSLSLLHVNWPQPVRRASVLDLNLQSLQGAATSHEDWRWMKGQLTLP